MMKRLISRLKPQAMILLILVLTGCINEDIQECHNGVLLRYQFLLNMQFSERIALDVDDIRTYIFNSDGLLVHILDEEVKPGELTDKYSKFIALPAGKYTIITWGGNLDFRRNYFPGHLNDPEINDYHEGVVVNETTINDFLMFIRYNEDSSNPEVDVTPTDPEFQDLFYGKVENVIVKQNGVTEVFTRLMKNTNTLQISIKNANTGAQSSYDNSFFSSRYNVWIVAKNACYRWDNQIKENTLRIMYSPFSEEFDIERNSSLFQIKTLRLISEFEDQFSAVPMYLFVRDKVNDRMIVDGNVDLVKSILSSKFPKYNQDGTFIIDPSTGKPLMDYPDLDYLKRNDTWPIEIEIGSDLAIKITINGWEVQIISPN